jgi:hypothetical protein
LRLTSLKMKKRYILLILLLFVLVVAAVTNPNADAHKSRLKAEVKDLVNSYSSLDQTPFSGLTGFLTNTAVDLGFDQAIEVNSYIFFSISRIKFGTFNQPVAVGVFGNVFMLKSLKDVVKELQTSLGM